MKYISTRTNKELFDFKQVTLRGLASDGGLYVPNRWDKVNTNLVGNNFSFEQTAFQIISSFIGEDIDKNLLKLLIKKVTEILEKKKLQH